MDQSCVIGIGRMLKDGGPSSEAFRWQTRDSISQKDPNGQKPFLPPSLPLSGWKIDENRR